LKKAIDYELGDLDFTIPGIWIRRSITRKVVGTPKNKHARFQVIPKELAQELKEWMLRVPSQILFPGKMGNLMSNNGLNEACKRLCEEAGVRAVSTTGP
jgi:integrase